MLIRRLWLCHSGTSRDSWKGAERGESGERTTALLRRFSRRFATLGEPTEWSERAWGIDWGTVNPTFSRGFGIRALRGPIRGPISRFQPTPADRFIGNGPCSSYPKRVRILPFLGRLRGRNGCADIHAASRAATSFSSYHFNSALRSFSRFALS